MKRLIYFIILLFVFVACSEKDDENKDVIMPTITDKGVAAIPENCQPFQKGDTIHFCYKFTDNMELGTYNIEIHHNFNHHTHSTSAVNCDLDAKKEPEKPWVYNQDYTIPDNLKEYISYIDIPIPKDIDLGDYHFMIRLTDKAGWQQLRSVSIKVVE